MDFKITKNTNTSAEIDESTLSFGDVFTDHILVVDYEDGSWKTPEIIPFSDWNLSPASAIFHYGQAVFEGMKAYRGDNGEVFLFRPEENFKRLNRSAERMMMPSIPKEIFINGLHKLLELDHHWIPKTFGYSLYIRPFMIATQPRLRARYSEKYRFCIILSPAGKYYSKPLKIKIAEEFSRSAAGGTGYAKAAGNYAASFFPTEKAIENGFDQVLWTDAATHSVVEEAGTMNIFFRFKDYIQTAPVNERILDGITRKSIIQWLNANGYKVIEKDLTVSDLIKGIEKGELIESFGCGTAVVVNPVESFGYQNKIYKLPDLGEDSLAPKLKKEITNIQYGKTEDPFGWRVKVF